jgi:threonine/homoserine/homoserine lactone efflux protein
MARNCHKLYAFVRWCLQELYSNQYLVLAGVATGFTVGPHVFMSLLLIIRQGWLQAASQACGFILTLNPLENLTPIPQGVLGLFVLSIGFIAYVLIAASGEVTADRLRQSL